MPWANTVTRTTTVQVVISDGFGCGTATVNVVAAVMREDGNTLKTIKWAKRRRRRRMRVRCKQRRMKTMNSDDMSRAASAGET